MDDHSLLMQYTNEGSEQAFEGLVEKYTSLVYSSAVRRVGPDMAKDITQAVFMILSRKAEKLAKREMKTLAGWLFRTTRFATSEALRSRARREHREEEASKEHSRFTEEMDNAPSWENVRPLIDAALDKLGKKDRDAVLLRYFQEASYADVGMALGLTENAATKRVARATDKLRTLLTRKGTTVSGAALATLLAANVAEAIPSGLTVASAAVVTSVAAEGTSAAVLIAEAAVKSMFLSQVKMAVVAGCALVATSAGTVAAISNVMISSYDPSKHIHIEHVEAFPLTYMARSRLPDNSVQFQLNSTRDSRSHFARIGDTLHGFRLVRHNKRTEQRILPGTPAPIPVDVSTLVLEMGDHEISLTINPKGSRARDIATIKIGPDNEILFIESGDRITISGDQYEIVHINAHDGFIRVRHVDSRQEFVIAGKK